MELQIIIVSWNTIELLQDCLNTLPQGAGQITYGVTVVDNASTDGSADMVAQKFPDVKLIRNAENVGFSRANNQALRRLQKTSPYFLLLNSDTRVLPGALETLVQFMDAHPRVGACSPRLERPNGSAQAYAFGKDPTLGYLLARGWNRLIYRRPLHNWETKEKQKVDWVSGACLMVRGEVLDQVGLLDEKIFMYFEDNDWCHRIRLAGWDIIYNPQTAIIHLGGQSLIRNPQAQQAYYRSLEYFYAKHYGPLALLGLRILLPFYRRFI